jgi:hypothetical protein
MFKYFKKPPICEAVRVLKDCRATGKKKRKYPRPTSPDLLPVSPGYSLRAESCSPTDLPRKLGIFAEAGYTYNRRIYMHTFFDMSFYEFLK